jgi:hypothetical protein
VNDLHLKKRRSEEREGGEGKKGEGKKRSVKGGEK